MSTPTPPDAPRDPSPTMADIARLTGVSAMTVSRALRDDGSVAPGTRARIVAAVEDLGYVVDRTATMLARRQTGFVAVLIPSLNNPHFANTVRGLTERVGERLQLLLGHTDYRVAQEERLLRALLGRRPDAIVLTMDGHSAGARRLLARSGIPVVEIWDLPAEPIAHVVGYSNRAAGRALTEHLIGLGHRRIGYIGEAVDRNTRGAQRRHGHLDALAAAGLEAHRVVQHDAPPIGMEGGAAAFAALMDRWPETEAIACVSDPCAFGAVSACRRRGWAVPDRVSIAGFGDFEVSRASHPRITTVLVDADAIGRRAGDVILDAIDGRLAGSAARIDVGFEVIPRETTAARRPDDASAG